METKRIRMELPRRGGLALLRSAQRGPGVNPSERGVRWMLARIRICVPALGERRQRSGGRENSTDMYSTSE